MFFRSFFIPQPKDFYCTEDLFGSREQILVFNFVIIINIIIEIVPIQCSGVVCLELILDHNLRGF